MAGPLSPPEGFEPPAPVAAATQEGMKPPAGFLPPEPAPVPPGQPKAFNARLADGKALTDAMASPDAPAGAPRAGGGLNSLTAQDGSSWGSRAANAVKAVHDAVGAGKMSSEWAAAATREGAAARAQVGKGITEIGQGMSATGVGDLFWGAAAAVWAPFGALGDVAGQEATKATGNPDFGAKVNILAQGMMGVPESGEAALALRHLSRAPDIGPGVVTKEGDFARLVHDPATNEVHAQIVGRAPTPGTFKQAGKDVARLAGKEGDLEAEAKAQQHLQNAWTLEGIHPNEAIERASQSAAIAHDLSSAHAPAVPIPMTPTPDFIKNADDTFNRIKTRSQARDSFWLQWSNDLPEGLRSDPAMKERFLRYMEGDPTHGMTPADMKVYKDVVEPMRAQQAELYEWLSKTDLPRLFKDTEGREFEMEFDPEYAHKMRKGYTPGVDQFTGEAGDAADPILAGRAPGMLNTHPSSLEHASYWTLRDQDGNRRLVRMTDGGKNLTMVDKKKPWAVELKNDKEVPVNNVAHPEERKWAKGDTVKDKEGNTWELTNAWHSEIESLTPVRYYHDPMLSLVNSIREMQTAKEAIYSIQQLKDTPEFGAYARPRSLPAPDDWITPDMPFFEGYKMHPKLAAVIDNFYRKPMTDPYAAVASKVNRAAVRSLFLTPVPHLFNETGFLASRYLFKPQAWGRLLNSTVKAIPEVVTNGKLYRDFQREGASFHYGATLNSQEGGFYARLMRNFGEEIEKKQIMPEGWEGIADTLGEKPANVIAAWYRMSSRALWLGTDVMHMASMMERMDAGMGTREAVEWAEKWMPDYRTPPQLLGNTALRDFYFNNLTFEFSRYHYDIFKGYANMIKGLVRGSGPERLDAIGTLLGVAAIQTVAYPAIQAIIHRIPGLEDAEVPSFGPGKIMSPVMAAIVNHSQELPWPKEVKDYYNDKDGSFLKTFNAFFPFAPAAKVFVGAFTPQHLDYYTGEPIVQPGETNPIREAGQAIDWAGRQLITPYEMAAEAWKHGLTAPQILTQTLLGLPTKTPEEKEIKEYYKHKDALTAIRHRNYPRGPIEELGNYIAEHLGGD